MRIVSNSPDVLVVEDRPLFWSLALASGVLIGTAVFIHGLLTLDAMLLIWGALFGGGALAMFLLTLTRVRIYFDRKQDLVELRAQRLRGTTRQQFALRNLRRAEVQSSGDTHRIALDFIDPHGVVPVRLAYDSSPSHARVAAEINDWLNR